MILSDLAELETGTPKFIQGRLVNFYKLHLQAHVIFHAQQFQASRFLFRRVDPICDYLFDTTRTLPSDLNAESRGLEHSTSLMI